MLREKWMVVRVRGGDDVIVAVVFLRVHNVVGGSDDVCAEQ